MHECCLTASMWQETFGPHDLVRMHGSIYGHRVRILIDNGATHNFLNYKLVKKLKLAETKSSHRYVVSTTKGDDHDVWDTQVQQVLVFVLQLKTKDKEKLPKLSKKDAAKENEELWKKKERNGQAIP